MDSLPQVIRDTIEAFSELPGIGTRSAERLVLTLLNNKSGIDKKLSENIGKLKTTVKECKECFHYSENDTCSICSSSSRDNSTLCIIESPLDLLALERSHEYKGLYHVLHGTLSPLNKIGPEKLRIKELLSRVKKLPELSEIILATSGSTEGDATALYLIQELSLLFKGKITQLARGIPSGGELDYLDIGTLGRAILDRR